ncbi:hypothetical protein ACVNS2_24645 [Paenibacillus caseinilyticus]|uniref:Uncharacterized protein n=1 Tax=Paenibacillus mucilaginosus K02 TaxID=997761 RepID=R9ULM7_9BACL|nr:hypothetical protein [Paenibacillus mucilaginosus]AGN70754.1 hypothetical protein B2K_39900 [Paenibacillus mucilaginosus K02]
MNDKRPIDPPAGDPPPSSEKPPLAVPHRVREDPVSDHKRIFLFQGCLTAIAVCTPFWILLLYLLVKWIR